MMYCTFRVFTSICMVLARYLRVLCYVFEALESLTSIYKVFARSLHAALLNIPDTQILTVRLAMLSIK